MTYFEPTELAVAWRRSQKTQDCRKQTEVLCRKRLGRNAREMMNKCFRAQTPPRGADVAEGRASALSARTKPEAPGAREAGFGPE